MTARKLTYMPDWCTTSRPQNTVIYARKGSLDVSDWVMEVDQAIWAQTTGGTISALIVRRVRAE